MTQGPVIASPVTVAMRVHRQQYCTPKRVSSNRDTPWVGRFSVNCQKSPSSINIPKGNINTVDVRRRVVSTSLERDIDIFSKRVGDLAIDMIQLQVVRLFIEYLLGPTQGWGRGGG